MKSSVYALGRIGPHSLERVWRLLGDSDLVDPFPTRKAPERRSDARGRKDSTTLGTELNCRWAPGPTPR